MLSMRNMSTLDHLLQNILSGVSSFGLFIEFLTFKLTKDWMLINNSIGNWVI